ITTQLSQDLKKHNEQYPPIAAYEFPHSHDRFLIIDHNAIYHIGASLKDLGKKWFAFSRMQTDTLNFMDQLQQRLTL
ncbi:MAG: ORF6N domain-containing protein, partial [Pseudomonadota bacterium]